MKDLDNYILEKVKNRVATATAPKNINSQTVKVYLIPLESLNLITCVLT